MDKEKSLETLIKNCQCDDMFPSERKEYNRTLDEMAKNNDNGRRTKIEKEPEEKPWQDILFSAEQKERNFNR